MNEIASTVSMRDCAVAYARGGLPVFPLAPGQKVPLLSHAEGGRGFRDATTEVARVRRWWEASPEANIGATPLVHDGLCQAVVDVDVQNDGDVTWNRLVEQHGGIPATLRARSGQGGQHIWFWVSERGRSKLGRGVDCKFGDTGYVVVPPSVHPLTGARYAWLSVAPVAPAPDWLRLLIRQPVRRATSTVTASCVTASCLSNALVRFVAASQEGERNERLFWAACRAFEGGSFVQVEAGLEDAALSVGLPWEEIVSVFRSAERRAG